MVSPWLLGRQRELLGGSSMTLGKVAVCLLSCRCLAARRRSQGDAREDVCGDAACKTAHGVSG